MSTTFDATVLRSLPRAELQKLARANNIKGNLKSEAIIQRLARSKPPDARPNCSTAIIIVEDDQPNEISRDTEGNKNAREVGAPPPPTTNFNLVYASQGNGRQPNVTPPQTPRSDSRISQDTQSTYASRLSSVSNSPILSEIRAVERAVNIMESISKDDKDCMVEIASLKAAAARLRKQAEDLRKALSVAKGRREEMQSFFLYWQKIDPKWSTIDVYEDQMYHASQNKPTGSGRVSTEAPVPNLEATLKENAQMLPEQQALRAAQLGLAFELFQAMHAPQAPTPN